MDCEAFGVRVPCWVCDLLLALIFLVLPRVLIAAVVAIWFVGLFTVLNWLF